MSAKEQLIREIAQASDSLAEEVLKFLLLTKARFKANASAQTNQPTIIAQLQEMAEDPDIQAEISAIEAEFSATETDRLT